MIRDSNVHITQQSVIRRKCDVMVGRSLSIFHLKQNDSRSKSWRRPKYVLCTDIVLQS